MGATIALIMFATFIALDYFLQARKEKKEQSVRDRARVRAPFVDSEPQAEPIYVGGYELVPGLSYHPGHTWAQVVSDDTVVVGMDDFARRLLGKVKRFELPKKGSWLVQGAKGVGVETDRGHADLLSPIEGEVVRVNRDVGKDPETATDDPYRRGWLYEVRGPHLASNLHNLMRGTLAQGWIQDAKARLTHRLVGLSGTVMADGGEPADDFANHLKAKDWSELAHDFLGN